jgi:hypothetical protein
MRKTVLRRTNGMAAGGWQGRSLTDRHGGS